MYDYLKGKIFIEIGDVKTSDSKTLEAIIEDSKMPTEGNTLFLQDLGYFKTKTLLMIDSAENFFISKLKFKLIITDANGKIIDLNKILKKKPEHIEMYVKLGDLNCRLVGCKLPDKIVNGVLRRANENANKKGRKISKEYKLFLTFGIYITNLPENYTKETVHTMYRLRWQIELIFKTWKSILKIHKIHSEREERVLCEVYGKLIFALIVNRIHRIIIYTSGIICSYHRELKYIKSIAFKWGLSIIEGLFKHELFLKGLISQLKKLCKKVNQKDKPTIEELLSTIAVDENHETKAGKVV